MGRLLLLLLCLGVSCASAATDQFQDWYPEFGFIFDEILHTKCTTEYDQYLTGAKNSTIDPDARSTGAGYTNQLTQPVVNCILEYSSEFVKSSMASAQVLLGLTPPILAAVGSTTEETATLFVLARRPILAFLVTLGSPAVHPLRTFRYNDPVGQLREREGRLHPPRHLARVEAPIVFLEYLVALASIANLATLSLDLGYQVSCTFAPHLTYLPLLWAILGVVSHLTGAVALSLRARVRSERSPALLDWLKGQIGWSKPTTLRVELFNETYFFIFLTWFASIYTTCHVIYGTLTFSSMLFISVRDSVAVIGRYMASVLCCRVILMYELAKLRHAFNVENGGEVWAGCLKDGNERASQEGSNVELRRMLTS